MFKKINQRPLTRINSTANYPKSLFKILAILFFIALQFNTSFAGEPIPGISVGLGRNPGGIMMKTTTGTDGKFTFNLKEGKYDLTISYEEIVKVINRMDKNKGSGKEDYDVTLILDGEGMTVNEMKAPTNISFGKETGTININVEKPTVLKGTLSYKPSVILHLRAAPIPGIRIIVKKDPGGKKVTQETGTDGKFSVDLEEGRYDLQISYDKILEAISRIDKNKDTDKEDYEITLMLNGEGLTVNDNKGPANIKINKETGIISISLPKGGGAIKGKLDFSISQPGVK